ncbi:MAG: YraN family protein [Gemmatimonadota bacterium]|nr:YraN family protein [Gemmatimonadota bacterium]
MTRQRCELGEAGEAIAARHLERNGYRILARRFRAAGREIDLVARRGGVIAIVEVKTRSGDPMAPPETAVDRRKRRQILAAARVAAARWPARGYRFDVIAVTRGKKGVEVRHIEDAFRPG